jgi:queuine/archaeosine tRNA-ribosyltransferase
MLDGNEKYLNVGWIEKLKEDEAVKTICDCSVCQYKREHAKQVTSYNVFLFIWLCDILNLF